MARLLFTYLSIYLSIEKSTLRLFHHTGELEKAHDLVVGESWAVYELVSGVVTLHIYLNMQYECLHETH
jgi:hypothetical protein